MATRHCSGNGECLEQTDDENTYGKRFDCEFDCQAIKCPNHDICGASGPLWYLNCHNGLCCNCNMMFGTWQGGKGILKHIEDEECCVCMEDAALFELQRCNHTMCASCIRKSYYLTPEEHESLASKPEYLSKCPICRA